MTAIWEAAGYPCSVRLKALLPLWLPWAIKRYGIAKQTETDLLTISAGDHGSASSAEKAQAQKAALRAHQARHLAETPYPDQNRFLERDHALGLPRPIWSRTRATRRRASFVTR